MTGKSLGCDDLSILSDRWSYLHTNEMRIAVIVGTCTKVQLLYIAQSCMYKPL
jgi:hypothetical protein